MKNQRTVLVGVLILLLAFATACTKPPLRGALTGQPISIDDPRALEIIAGHLERAARTRALRGVARVVLEGPDFKLNRPQRIAIARPNRLRFEVLGLFDVLAAMLVSDGREFGFYEADTGEITRGPMTPELLWEFAQLDLEADEVVGLLLGSPTPSPTMELAGIWLESDEGIMVAYFSRDEVPLEQIGQQEELQEGGVEPSPCGAPCAKQALGHGAEIFRFGADGFLREMRSIDPGRVTRFRAEFEDYGDPGGPDAMRRFPMQITVLSPRVDAMARFEWKRIMLTEELPDRLFKISGKVHDSGKRGPGN